MNGIDIPHSWNCKQTYVEFALIVISFSKLISKKYQMVYLMGGKITESHKYLWELSQGIHMNVYLVK